MTCPAAAVEPVAVADADAAAAEDDFTAAAADDAAVVPSDVVLEELVARRVPGVDLVAACLVALVDAALDALGVDLTAAVVMLFAPSPMRPARTAVSPVADAATVRVVRRTCRRPRARVSIFRSLLRIESPVVVVLPSHHRPLAPACEHPVNRLRPAL